MVKKKVEPKIDKKSKIASIKYSISIKKEIITELKQHIKEYEEELKKLK